MVYIGICEILYLLFYFSSCALFSNFPGKRFIFTKMCFISISGRFLKEFSLFSEKNPLFLRFWMLGAKIPFKISSLLLNSF